MKKYLFLSTFEVLFFTAIFYSFTLLAKIDHYNNWEMFITNLIYFPVSIFLVNFFKFRLGKVISYETINTSASLTALLLVIFNIMDEHKFIGNSLSSNHTFRSIIICLIILWFFYYVILVGLLLLIDIYYDNYFNEI